MKKILLLCICLISLCSCSLTSSPKSKVEAYLGKYNTLNEDVVSDIDNVIASENLSVGNQTIYKDVLKRQYQDMKYKIKDEKIDGDNAVVTVSITVYDLYKSQKMSSTYLNEHINDYYVDNVFDEENYVKYRLDNMLKTADTIDYEITFALKKQDDSWVLNAPDTNTLEKLHGLYNYDV